MGRAAFLDTGVVLGFCFRDDGHHYRCKEYLEDHGDELYLSDHVQREHLNREPDLAEEISDGIFAHVSRLQRSEFEGQLDSMDTSMIRQNLISGDNPAARSLNEFYKEEVPNFIQLNEIVSRLRSLARDIEQNAVRNRQWLMQRSVIWERDDEYPDLETALSEIPWDDRRICLDAHDVAARKEPSLELVTVNPRDLVDDDHDDLIVGATALEAVVSLAVRS